MDTALLPYTDEHRAFRETVRRFVADEVVPHHRDWENAGRVPHALWRKAGSLGLLCPAVPEIYGGGGVDFIYSTIVTEELC